MIALQLDEVERVTQFKLTMEQPVQPWKRKKLSRLQEAFEGAGINGVMSRKQDLPTMTTIPRQIERHHSKKIVLPWLAA
ncbi:hypothetical protein [Arthrobacter sulfonylureivorans]|uniref:Uncharacterized protein n=1 Tax=Arthrobacter sulfonylureivorans TaxID=2486855 RepID=A0ABY3W9R8_9MICC|nr:hypothetical protein [Arthrobacter sulfonylureivorans]UNK47098.1 hypothetical protein MNQ99_07080 [Arthrobacter sulfonylureivorans]